MLTLFTAFALSFPAMASDTPPALPIPVERLTDMKTHADVIAASRLPDGSHPSGRITLPQLDNRADVLAYMIDHYPPELRDRHDFEMPWLWMLVDTEGRMRGGRVVKTSGKAAFDSLAIAALRVARFTPATLQGRPVDLWMPMPIQVAYEDLARRSSPEKPTPGEPHFTPYTQKPTLLNRQEVSQALVKNYPPDLRAVGVGGTVLTWVLVDEQGHIADVQVKESSGNDQLDSAAMAVARVMRFTPARNQNVTVPVWIALPIVFRSR
jgi:TonB family protein